MDGVGIEPRYAARQDVMKIGPVHLQVGRAVAFFVSFGERQFLKHFTRTVEPELCRRRLERDTAELFFNAEGPHHMHGVRALLNAGADFAQRCGLLVDFDVETGLDQAPRRRQPTEARARNDDFVG